MAQFAGDEAAPEAELGRRKAEGILGDGFGNASDLEKDKTGTDNGDPELGSSLAFAHSGFRRACRDGLMREDTDPDLALALQRTVDRDTAGLNLLTGDPATLEGLQAELAKVDVDATRGVAGA